jgi:pimeloyl-ACP methyl ester carboxylesterase
LIPEPCVLVASSDSCAYAVEAAQRRPDLFSKLVLVCPPSSRDKGSHDGDADVQSKLVKTLFKIPVLGTTILNIFASRSAVRGFAERHLYFDKALVTEKTVSAYYVAAHQPGTVYGFASFLSSALSHDAREAWSNLEQPALLVWGRNALINPLETAPEWLALKPDAQLEVIDRAMLLPHSEHPDEWNRRVLAWLQNA